MTASLLLATVVRRTAAALEWVGMRTPPPPPAQPFDGDDEPERQREAQLWTYFIQNPRPTSMGRDESI
jgi:hypothetical protein